jgi:hypothetical protein
MLDINPARPATAGTELTDDAIRALRAAAYEADDETTLCLCEAALLRSETATVHGIGRAEARRMLAERVQS